MVRKLHQFSGLFLLVSSLAVTPIVEGMQIAPTQTAPVEAPQPQIGSSLIPEQLPQVQNSLPVPSPAPRQTNAIQLPVQQPIPFSVRVKDITTIEGHRSNRLEGLGLVTGLDKTGGKGETTRQFARNMFQNKGFLNGQPPTNSLAAVYVTVEVPPFHKPGEKLIASVAITDDATSLFGGLLMQTELYGLDGQVYAMAGGPLQIGGFSVGGDAASVRKNHATVGKVEVDLEVEICDGAAFKGNRVRLLLRNKDFTTAYRIAREINKFFPNASQANDGGSVDVIIPAAFRNNPVEFIVMINDLRVEPDHPAKVVINEKTGTIVVGKNVRLSSVAFAKDNLVISTSETPVASQPAPFSGGETVVLPRTQIDAVQTGGRYNVLPANTTVGDLANVLNTLGIPPQDIISVFLALRQEGSLQAELEIE